MSKAAISEKTEEKVFAKLREICFALPEAQETRSCGHPTFKAGKKTFAVLERFNGHLCIVFMVTPALQQLLIEDTGRYFITPYIGKLGGVSMIVDHAPNWKDVRRLVRESYSLVTKPRSKKA